MIPWVSPRSERDINVELAFPGQQGFRIVFADLVAHSNNQSSDLRVPALFERAASGLPGRTVEQALEGFATAHGRYLISQARRDLGEALTETGTQNNLKTVRLAAGLSQSELARQLGTSQSYVARLEAGKIRNPTRHRLEQLSRIFSVGIDQLLELLDA